MAVNLERFIKGKRFTQEFNLDDGADQVIPKVSAGSVIGNAISTAASGATSAAIAAVSGSIAAATQTLSSSGQTICISNGNCVTLPELDNQTLSMSGQTLSISGGNSVTIPGGTTTGNGVGTVTGFGYLGTSANPPNGTWLTSDGVTSLAPIVTTSGPTNSVYNFQGIVGSTWVSIRGSDGIWRGGPSGSLITLPPGVFPTQTASYVTSS